MKFFKPEDFMYADGGQELRREYVSRFSNLANKLLEERGKVVYGKRGIDCEVWTKDKLYNDHLKALIINIEEIKKCEHPVEKIKGTLTTYNPESYLVHSVIYTCECGVKVTPTAFAEVK